MKRKTPAGAGKSEDKTKGAAKTGATFGGTMKTVALYRPFTIEKALDDFDRYMESFFGESPLTPAVRKAEFAPSVDVRETDGAYLLEAELPGYDEKDLRIQLDGNVLTIETNREEEGSGEASPKQSSEEAKPPVEAEHRFILRERRSASFRRSFRLPDNADTGSISAHFKNGLLNLEIKKQSEAQRRIIQIKAS
jgi:HSP20 family protein